MVNHVTAIWNNSQKYKHVELQVIQQKGDDLKSVRNAFLRSSIYNNEGHSLRRSFTWCHGKLKFGSNKTQL